MKNRIAKLSNSFAINTSKCDALALETFYESKKRETSYRVKRGLYCSQARRYKNGKWRQVYLNADINGALNIGRKHLAKMKNEGALKAIRTDLKLG